MTVLADIHTKVVYASEFWACSIQFFYKRVVNLWNCRHDSMNFRQIFFKFKHTI